MNNAIIIKIIEEIRIRTGIGQYMILEEYCSYILSRERDLTEFTIPGSSVTIDKNELLYKKREDRFSSPFGGTHFLTLSLEASLNSWLKRHFAWQNQKIPFYKLDQVTKCRKTQYLSRAAQNRDSAPLFQGVTISLYITRN